MNLKHHITPTMKSIRFILAISVLALSAVVTQKAMACGEYRPSNPAHIRFFRCCSPELEQQWQEGCRFQDYEKDENCLLWQKITSPTIPLKDIEHIVYDTSLKDLHDLQQNSHRNNGFAKWLCESNHKEDLDYLLIAKEIEEIRKYMTTPWYYAYDGDEEHLRLNELMGKCKSYSGKRHAPRYALQMTRLYFAQGEYQNCIDLWEKSACEMPRDIVTDMIASYVGGAYSRKGNREKAIELFTRSQDIGSLINLKVWNEAEDVSLYSDSRVKELEYIFNRFPNSPLLSVRLQKYVRDYEDCLSAGYEGCVREWDFRDPYLVGNVYHNNLNQTFYDELKRFGQSVTFSKDCNQKGMWWYALAYIYYLEGIYYDKDNRAVTMSYLSKAENTESTPFIRESIKAFRILMDASHSSGGSGYRAKLLNDLEWLDECMQRDVELSYESWWQYYNWMNYSFYYWQDVARRVLLGEVCPKMAKAGYVTLALQLANYASNRIYQLSSLYKLYRGCGEGSRVLTMEDFRKTWSESNDLDYSNLFFVWINSVPASEAATYAERISNPKNKLDRFLNERSYVDSDYIYDIVGTSYLREMNYDMAVYWLSKVSKDYQARTNIAKAGYFKLDPFKFQFNKKQYISDSNDYKLKFAQEMSQLERLIMSDAEPNRKANAKIRFATGLRNSFGRCWYLTAYGYEARYEPGDEYTNWKLFTSQDREGFEGDQFAQGVYKRVDKLMAQALSEFTDPEQAAQAQLEMMNFSTVMKLYPQSKAAEAVRSRCDNYYDYAIQKR